jgi:hypothetical protein
MSDWVLAQPGVGLVGFALLLARTRTLDRFPSIAKLWKFLGLSVNGEGRAPKLKAGEMTSHTDCTFWHLAKCKPTCKTNHHQNCVPGGVGNAFSSRGRVVCRVLAKSIVTANRGPYRAAYDRKKAEYEAGRPDWSQGRRHNAAMRYAIKEFVKDLWIAWHKRRRTQEAA